MVAVALTTFAPIAGATKKNHTNGNFLGFAHGSGTGGGRGTNQPVVQFRLLISHH